MKKIFSLLAVLAVFFIYSNAYASVKKGVVVYYNYSSDKIIIETSMGYTCAEVYSGYSVDEGHIIIGELESYGFKDVYDSTNDNAMRIWIDEYWMSKEEALDWLGS